MDNVGTHPDQADGSLLYLMSFLDRVNLGVAKLVGEYAE